MLESRSNTLRWPPLVVAGLTGGIASGKSTIARMFAALGAVVINADDIGRAIVAPGEPALAELLAAFGPECLRPDGALDRSSLARRVFSSSGDHLTLNRITHPRIAARLQEQLRNLARHPASMRTNPPIAIVEAAVLVEAGWVELVDRVIVVVTQPSTQLQRLMAELGLDAPQAADRVRSQIPLRKRLRHAHYRVSGEAPLIDTQAQATTIWRDLVRVAERKREAARGQYVGT